MRESNLLSRLSLGRGRRATEQLWTDLLLDILDLHPNLYITRRYTPQKGFILAETTVLLFIRI